METKICKKCGRELSIDNFYKKKNGKPTCLMCKECTSKIRKEYYIKNKDIIIERQKEYYRKNSKDIIVYSLEYEKLHPEKMKEKYKRKAKRRQQAIGNFTDEQWNECILFFNNTCAYSGEYFGEDLADKISKDHIIPISLNGTNYIWNIIPVKFKYNSSRGNAKIREWYSKQPFYSEERLDLIRQWKKYARAKWS